MERLSKTRVDRLGETLREGAYGETELRLLDEYRRGFGSAYDAVVERVQRALGVPVSGRPTKSTTSIIEKLKRESIRLSQMQDIAGCRVVVSDAMQQQRAVEALVREFPENVLFDRRTKPSHGYRAVHLVVREVGRPIEVQIRTSLQHSWAQLSEKYADLAGPSVKYGGGPDEVRDFLQKFSSQVAEIERLEHMAHSGVAGAEFTRRVAALRDDVIAATRSWILDLESFPTEES